MRQSCLLLATTLLWLFGAQQAIANCAVIDRLHQLQVLQIRIAQNPQNVLFFNDIQQARAISGDISNRAAIEAIDGNALAGKGARIARFLQNTQALINRVSVDDPLSVRPHFTRQVLQNIRAVQTDLTALRCTNAEREAESTSFGDEPSFSSSTDAEDLAEVANVMRAVSEEVFRPRSLVIVVLIGGLFAIALPILRQWQILRLRQAKRHNTLFDTDYKLASEGSSIQGTLIDINCYGSKLQHNRTAPHDLGTNLELRIDEDWIKGTVMWSNAFYSGVKFTKTISLLQVARVCEETKNKIILTKKRKTAPRKAPS